MCWRARGTNPFAVNPTPVTCGARAAATASPMPGQAASLTGAAITEALRAAVGAEADREVIIKEVPAGVDPTAPGSGMTLGDGATELFDNYVAWVEGAPHVYLEIPPLK